MNRVSVSRRVQLLLLVGLWAGVSGCSQRTVVDGQCVETTEPHENNPDTRFGTDTNSHEVMDSNDDDSALDAPADSAEIISTDTDTKSTDTNVDTGLEGSDPGSTGDSETLVDTEPLEACAAPVEFDAVEVDYSFMGRGNDALAAAIEAIQSGATAADNSFIFGTQSDWDARTGGIALPDMNWSSHGLVLIISVPTSGGHTFFAKPVFSDDLQGERMMHLFITAPWAGDVDTDCGVADSFAIVVPLPDLPDTVMPVEYVRCDPGSGAYEIMPCMNQLGWP